MVSAIAPTATLGRVRRLGGGLATATFAFDLQGAGNGRYVVKRYDADDETAPREWERLSFAQRVPVPVPEPVALDAEGSWFGTPALVMRRLPGRADVQPADVDAWLRELALALVTIHDTSLAGAEDALLKAPHAETWEPPAGLRTSALSDRVVGAIEQYLPRATWEPVLTHGDFHPGNVLWRRQRDQRSRGLEHGARRTALVRARLSPRGRGVAPRGRRCRPSDRSLRVRHRPRPGRPPGVRPDLWPPRAPVGSALADARIASKDSRTRRASSRRGSRPTCGERLWHSARSARYDVAAAAAASRKRVVRWTGSVSSFGMTYSPIRRIVSRVPSSVSGPMPNTS